MSEREQLERDIIDYGGFPPLNIYIVNEAKRKLSEMDKKVIGDEITQQAGTKIVNPVVFIPKKTINKKVKGGKHGGKR